MPDILRGVYCAWLRPLKKNFEKVEQQLTAPDITELKCQMSILNMGGFVRIVRF
jgi:hypothetical protein